MSSYFLFAQNASDYKGAVVIPTGVDVRFEKPKPFSTSYCYRRPIKIVWYFFDLLGFFSNNQYAVCSIEVDSILVHESFIFPKFFRFEFMAPEDLQIGNTWTSVDQRGKGLATLAIQLIAQKYINQSNTLWYITESANTGSISAVTKAGFRRLGIVTRVKRFGFRLLGKYIVRE
jgi:hypothetical protein